MKTSEGIKMKREVAMLKRQISDCSDDSTKLDDAKHQIDNIEADIQNLKSSFNRDDMKWEFFDMSGCCNKKWPKILLIVAKAVLSNKCWFSKLP